MVDWSKKEVKLHGIALKKMWHTYGEGTINGISFAAGMMADSKIISKVERIRSTLLLILKIENQLFWLGINSKITLLGSYPSATSSNIITVKPTINHMAAKSLFPFSREPGITSSTVTKIIAPAANAKAYGNKGSIIETSHKPTRPEIGSTNPDSWPYQNAFPRDIPSRLSGIDTDVPSGKFCKPIPIAKVTAPTNWDRLPV